MADKKKLSVAEILAAARKLDGGEDASQESAAAPAEATSAEPTSAEPASTEATSTEATEGKPAAESPEKPTPAKTSGKPASGGASSSGGRPSVAEMMAMARGEKKGGAPDKSAPDKSAPGKPAPSEAKKPAAAQASAKPAAKPASKAAKEKPTSGAPRDTASILAAARSAHRAGPMSKADAAKVQPAAKPVKKPVSVPPLPEKPAYAVAPTKRSQEAAKGSRRSFFLGVSGVLLGSSLAIGFASMSVTFGLWLLGTARFMFPNVLRVPPSQFKVGFPSDFAPGQVETKFKAKFGIWVVSTEYNGEPQLFALKSVCTHLGCTPNWLEAEQKFKCPCHGSGFYKDGINFEGPAPRPLERYAIGIAADGQVMIDKSRTFQEEMGQWADSASFIPV